MTSPLNNYIDMYGINAKWGPPIFSPKFLEVDHQGDVIETGISNWSSAINQICKEFDLLSVFRQDIYTIPNYNPQKSFPRVTTPDVDYFEYSNIGLFNGLFTDRVGSNTGNFLSNSNFDPRTQITLEGSIFSVQNPDTYVYQREFDVQNSEAMRCIMYYHWDEYHDMFAPGDVGGSFSDYNYQEALRVILQRFPLRWYFYDDNSRGGSGIFVQAFDKMLPYPFMESSSTYIQRPQAPIITGSPPELRYSAHTGYVDVNQQFYDLHTNFETIGIYDNVFDPKFDTSFVQEFLIWPRTIVANEASLIPLSMLKTTITHAESGWDTMLNNPRVNRFHPWYPHVDDALYGKIQRINETGMYGVFSWGSFHPQGLPYLPTSLPFNAQNPPRRYMYCGDDIVDQLIPGEPSLSIYVTITGDRSMNVPIPCLPPSVSFQLNNLIAKPTGWLNDDVFQVNPGLISGVPHHSGGNLFCDLIHQINSPHALLTNVFAKNTTIPETFVGTGDHNSWAGWPAPGSPFPSSIPRHQVFTFDVPAIDYIGGHIAFSTVLEATGLAIRLNGVANPIHWDGISNGNIWVPKYIMPSSIQVLYFDGFEYFYITEPTGVVFPEEVIPWSVDLGWTMAPTGILRLYKKPRFFGVDHADASFTSLPYYTDASGSLYADSVFFPFNEEIEINLPGFNGIDMLNSESGSNFMIDKFDRMRGGVDESGNGLPNSTIELLGFNSHTYGTELVLTLRTMWNVLPDSGNTMVFPTGFSLGAYPDGTKKQGMYFESERSFTQTSPLEMDLSLSICEVDVPLFGAGQFNMTRDVIFPGNTLSDTNQFGGCIFGGFGP